LSPNPLQYLWSITIGPITYSLEATSLYITEHKSSVLSIGGGGIAHMTGKDDTLGTWVLTANDIGGALSFSASSGTVPEPATLMLLGSGLVGLAYGVRRRFKK